MKLYVRCTIEYKNECIEAEMDADNEWETITYTDGLQFVENFYNRLDISDEFEKALDELDIGELIFNAVKQGYETTPNGVRLDFNYDEYKTDLQNLGLMGDVRKLLKVYGDMNNLFYHGIIGENDIKKELVELEEE